VDDATVEATDQLTIGQECMAAAPLVVNGAAYVGCGLPKGHEGQHSITIKWDSRG